MNDTKKLPIEEREFIMGEVMHVMSFDELIRELTGVSYSEMCKEFSENGVRDE